MFQKQGSGDIVKRNQPHCTLVITNWSFGIKEGRTKVGQKTNLTARF
ncbi:hypothetical protein ACEW7V_02550 [Areca yellow leaf disease phytoplasma]